MEAVARLTPGYARHRVIHIAQLRLLGRHLRIKCPLDGRLILFYPNLTSPGRSTHSPPPSHREQVTSPEARRVRDAKRYRIHFLLERWWSRSSSLESASDRERRLGIRRVQAVI